MSKIGRLVRVINNINTYIEDDEVVSDDLIEDTLFLAETDMENAIFDFLQKVADLYGDFKTRLEVPFLTDDLINDIHVKLEEEAVNRMIV